MSTLKLTAVGLYCPAGVFTRGVIAAGCEVIYSLHAGALSAAAHIKNFPDIPTVSKRTAWPLADLADDNEVDLVFAQPVPLTKSVVKSGQFEGDEPANDAVRIAVSMRPKVFVMEGGKELWTPPPGHPVSAWEQLFEASGYLTTRLRINWHHFGLAQLRRRTYLIATRTNLDFSDLKSPEGGAPTVRDAIADLENQPLAESVAEIQSYTAKPTNEFQKWCRRGSKGVSAHVDSPGASSVASLIPYLQPGQHVRQIPDEVYEKTYWPQRSKVSKPDGTGKPSMYYRRLHWDRPASMIPGDIRFLHPEHDRYITPREAARLMGIPDVHAFEGSPTRANLDAGRTVSPWVTERVLASIFAQLNKPTVREHQYQVDFKPTQEE